ncbi:MAG: S8 family serine peptidase [Myxococcota bacterium]
MIRRSLQLALIAAAYLSGAPLVAFAGDDLCGPFVLGASTQAVSELAEPGIRAGAAPDAAGSIVPLPVPEDLDAFPGAAGSPPESEAVLALPKRPGGGLPTDLELGPEARIADSYWSPVTCATIAKIAGPPGTPIERLVTVVPEGSALVPNDSYALAAAEVASVEAPPAEPDPYASLQYGLAVTGVREARGLSTGEGVTIALLDSAPETAHPDLSSARIQPLEGGAEMEVGVHGTLMAGVINAIEDNGFGIAGVAPGAEVVSIPVCRPTGSAGGRCTIYDLLQGLDQAWDAEASIVNLSLSGPPNALLERGVARLEQLGAVVVAAAGNEGTRDRRYPAAYPSVIGVGAVDRDGRVFGSSNRGSWVELMAPGVDVLSTVPESAFAFGNGTSLAAAHVTGSLAVLTSVTGDPKRARGELFRAAGARASERDLPKVCDVFARLGLSCDGPSEGAAASAD